MSEVIKKTCLNCKRAEWKLRNGGGLHPDGSGCCAWKVPEIKMPKAFIYRQPNNISVIPQPAGGRINRKNPCTDCETWEAGYQVTTVGRTHG